MTEVQFLGGAGIFLFATASLLSTVPGAPFPQVKQLGHEADYSCNAKVENVELNLHFGYFFIV
jgi:hypothetical protein